MTVVGSCSTVDHSSWGAYSITAGQEMPRLLWELKVHYRVRRIPPLDFSPDQLNSVSFLTSNLSKIIPNIHLVYAWISQMAHSLQVFRLKLNMPFYFPHSCQCSFTTMKDKISLNRKKIPWNFVVLLNMGCLLSVILYNRVFDTELTAAVEPFWNWKSCRVVYENFLEKGVSIRTGAWPRRMQCETLPSTTASSGVWVVAQSPT
jgi:hypothetical protein